MLTVILSILMFFVLITTSYLRDSSHERDPDKDKQAKEVQTFCTVGTVLCLIMLPLGWASVACWAAGLLLLDWSYGSNLLELPHTI